MPKRLCLESDCPNEATWRGRCPTCNRANEQATQRAGRSIYRTARWKHTRKRVLFNQPLCQCGAIATDVDHIIALEEGGAPWDTRNLQALCASCHSKKTRAEQADRGHTNTGASYAPTTPSPKQATHNSTTPSTQP